MRSLHPARPLDSSIDTLLNEIAAAGGEHVLILDDLQTVTDVECIESLDYALEHLPPNLRVIAITRIDPALRLAHLRAAGALTELRADELAFSAAEVRALLVDQAGLDLGHEEVERLREHTEGWPAALVLAALWLGSVDDPRTAVREFGGDHRFIVDYLTTEVLDALPEADRAFVLRIAVLGRVTAPLCDGVLGGSGAAAMLARLERSIQFVVRLERGGWYRVHPLFSQFACFRLAAEEPGAERELHRRAADWLQANGLPVEAAEHAAAASDHATVAHLLAEHHLALIRNGGERALLRRVQTLPNELVVEHPELAVAGATAATMLGRAVERRRLLQLAERTRAEYPERYSTVRRRGRRHGARRRGRRGRRRVGRGGAPRGGLAAAGADEALVAALAGYARALYYAGRPDTAWAAALRAVEHPDAARRAPGHAFARSTLALIALDRSQPVTARVHSCEARALVSAVGLSRSWLGAHVAAAYGLVLAAEGDPAGAERELVYAQHFLGDEVATVHHAWLQVVLARVRCARGRLAEADAALDAARATVRELADCGDVPALADAVEAQLRGARERARAGRARRGAEPGGAHGAAAPATPSSRSARSPRSCSSPSTRCAATRGRCTASSASAHARMRLPAPASSGCWGDRIHPGDSRRRRAPCPSGLRPCPHVGSDLSAGPRG